MTDEDEILAGELALGVLDGDELAGALRRVVADRDFARAVERWRDHFATWFASWPDVQPDPALEPRIMAALPGAAANDSGASRRIRLWRMLAGASTAAAAALLAALLLQPERVAPPRPQPRVEQAPAPLVAVLAPTGRGEPVAALVDRRTGAITLASAIDVPAGRAAELWTIAGDGVPRSLGVLGAGAQPRLSVRSDARTRLAGGVTLAVSIEPPGGSPTGSPTGPVIATGALRTV